MFKSIMAGSDYGTLKSSNSADYLLGGNQLDSLDCISYAMALRAGAETSKLKSAREYKDSLQALMQD